MKTTIFLTSVFSLFLFASAVHAAVFTRDLYAGLRSDSDVRALQQFLTDQGVYRGPITGNFFFLTSRAVADFQRREGIAPASGYFGPKTRARANELMVKVASPDTVPSAIQIRATEPPSPSLQSVQVDNAALRTQLENLLRQATLLQNQIRAQQEAQLQVPQQQTQTVPAQIQPSTPSSANLTIPAGQTIILQVPAAASPQATSTTPPPAATSGTSGPFLIGEPTNLIIY